MPNPPVSKLLVEGNDDLHVIKALCSRHKLRDTFVVEAPGGADTLIRSIPVQLKTARLQALGIVLDADENLRGRWDSVRNHLAQVGYRNAPKLPPEDGFITDSPARPRVGLWLMPNNYLSGMLEDFVIHLIPEGDELDTKAQTVLREIERGGLNRYAIMHRPKAHIYTWLAWQQTPGQPMGTAITARILGHDSPLALSFVDWLDRLFNAR